MMKDLLKYVISQFFVITVGILVITCLPNLAATFKGESVITYSAFYPYLVIFTGFLSSLPSVLLWFREEPTKKQCYIRMALHFVVVESIVMLEGYWFEWYKNAGEAVKLFGLILLVYLFVYIYSYFTNKDTADAINDALARFNQEEH